MSQHKKLAYALVLAVIFGVMLHPYADLSWLKSINAQLLQPLGQIFLRLIFMVVVPLIFSALIIATNEVGQHQGVGKIAVKTLVYTIVISSLSVVIGIGLVNTLKPGVGFQISSQLAQNIESVQKTTLQIQGQAASSKTASQVLVDLIPKNPLDSAVRALDGEMIPLMIFALIFGIALSLLASAQKDRPNLLLALSEQVFEACMKVMRFAMTLAPVGVFALVFNTIFISGYQILFSLFFYVATVILGLLIQQFVVYGSLIKFGLHQSPWQFFKACREVYLYAFSTSSSNATLPKALETAEQKLKIPRPISRFVLTVGASANQNGTAIFEGITVLFLAQVYGIDLSLSQQVYVVLFSILAGIGTAGVPGGSLPMVMVLIQSVGIPAEGIGIILGVDRFLDMCRTTINVSGDLVIAALVAAPERTAKARERAVV